MSSLSFFLCLFFIVEALLLLLLLLLLLGGLKEIQSMYVNAQEGKILFQVT